MNTQMWSLVTHQLENARTLATLDKDRPRQASLRRAVSTAYHALFQALCERCADKLVGWGKPWEVFTPVFRALDHTRTTQVLRLLADPREHSAADPNWERLREIFAQLQTAREWADYSPEPRPNFKESASTPPFTRNEALVLIDWAEEAIRILDGLNDEDRLKLAIRLVTKSRK